MEKHCCDCKYFEYGDKKTYSEPYCSKYYDSVAENDESCSEYKDKEWWVKLLNAAHRKAVLTALMMIASKDPN